MDTADRMTRLRAAVVAMLGLAALVVVIVAAVDDGEGDAPATTTQSTMAMAEAGEPDSGDSAAPPSSVAPSSSMAPPLKDGDPVGYTKWFVQQAVDLYEAEGLDALLDRSNDPGSVDGPWYVYVIGPDGSSVAHPLPRFRGQNVLGPIGVDVAGYRYGPDLLEITEEGGWITYHFVNPDGADCEVKHSWAVRRGEFIIGSGWYESAVVHPLLPSKCDPVDYTVATVDRAVERYRAVGREASIAYHSSAGNVDDRWYVFILDPETGTVLAHPSESFVGHNLLVGSEAYDDAGYNYAADLVKATEDGTFVRNVLSVPTVDEQNPFHMIEEVKHYYARKVDGLIFTSGWYTLPPTKADLAEYARLLVGRALTRFDDSGLEATLDYYNSEESLDGPWYVFVLEDRGGDLYSVANASRPDLIGTTRERIDASGFDYGEAFEAITETGGGEWVSYLFTHPETREDAPKHSWVVRRGDLLFGVGWYEGIE